MKKTLFLSTCLLCLSVSLRAQNPLSNYQFENWIANSQGDSVPEYWEYDSPFASDYAPAAGMMAGTKAANVSTWYNYVVGHLVNGAPESFTATQWTRYGEPIASNWVSHAGMAFGGYYKYECLPDTADKAGVQVLLKKWNTATLQSDTVGYGEMLLDSAQDWTHFLVNIDFHSQDMPDSIVVCFTSKLQGPGVGMDAWPHRLTIDELEIALALDAEVPISAEPVILYPLPARSKLQVKGVPAPLRAEIYDLQGRLLLRHEGDALISVGELPTGSYLMRLESGSTVRFKQFTKE